MKKNFPQVVVRVVKLVHGGQALGELEDNRKVFVWGALPGELVRVQLTRLKSKWAEGFVLEVLEASKDRIEPCEPDIYIATSPWQILAFEKESTAKQLILSESFSREGLDISWQDFYQQKEPHNYRNKMEYNFWFDTASNRVSLALHKRGSHTKVPISGSVLAMDAINSTGQVLVRYINEHSIEARPLKSVILRCDSRGTVGICLFVNDKNIAKEFIDFRLENSIFEVVYSDPKSPASVATESLISKDEYLCDELLGRSFKYSTRSFFQVNTNAYEYVLNIIAAEISKTPSVDLIDLYSGVGSIGLSVAGVDQKLTMIETSQECTELARLNKISYGHCQVVHDYAESALDYIKSKQVVILDPPRAGLHKHVTSRIIDVKPSKIIYLSCNPATQARDVKLLTNGGYEIDLAQGFNFFPRTPHIESLVVLKSSV